MIADFRPNSYSGRSSITRDCQGSSRGRVTVHICLPEHYIDPCTQSLHNKRVLSLDLAALLAGTGIRGQFEEKFKALLRDIEEEHGGVICFIDELRMFLYWASYTAVKLSLCLDALLNLGKAEGSVDAGQMIKPALARGLQLVGATTRKASI
jgi:ATP-dependent Clp protease ATP-binding subunit ClpA